MRYTPLLGGMLSPFASCGSIIFDAVACEGFENSDITESLIGVGQDVMYFAVDKVLNVVKAVFSKKI